MLDTFYIDKVKEFMTDKVKFAFLFGSVNTKYFNKKSDIDIAVWLKQFPISANEFINLKYQVEKSIDFKYDVDIVILNNADIIITNQIITKGKLIIDNEPEFTENFYLTRRNMYLDFKIFRKNLEKNLKTKIL